MIAPGDQAKVRSGSLQARTDRGRSYGEAREKCGGGRDKAMTVLGRLCGPRIHDTMHKLGGVLILDDCASLKGRQSAKHSNQV